MRAGENDLAHSLLVRGTYSQVEWQDYHKFYFFFLVGAGGMGLIHHRGKYEKYKLNW